MLAWNDLGQFHGLSGSLSSTGHYAGVLERIDVEGDAVVPDFSLSIGEKAVALQTHYIAVVGTNGNTYLKTVDARFLHTTLTVRGEIIDPPGPSRRRIVLTVATSAARVEDLLRLVTKGDGVPIDGEVKLHAKFELPSGSGDLIDRLSLNGRFEITRGAFANPQTQERIDALSRKGQGEPGNQEISNVLSNVRGTLLVRQTRARFERLEFSVPGAVVFLNRSYGLRSESIDLHANWSCPRNFRIRQRESSQCYCVGWIRFSKTERAARFCPSKLRDRAPILLLDWSCAAMPGLYRPTKSLKLAEVIRSARLDRSVAPPITN